MPYLYVGNLPANVSAREVRALLDNVCEHGSIEIKKTGRSAYAFAYFADRADAEEVMSAANGTDFCGHCVRVERARRYPGKAKSPSPSPSPSDSPLPSPPRRPRVLAGGAEWTSDEFKRCWAFLRSLRYLKTSSFDERYHAVYEDDGDEEPIDHQGGSYHVPKGWSKFALRLPAPLEEDWGISFHGTPAQNLADIVAVGELRPPGSLTAGGRVVQLPHNHRRWPDPRIFSSRTPRYAGLYADPMAFKGRYYQVMLMMRQDRSRSYDIEHTKTDLLDGDLRLDKFVSNERVGYCTRDSSSIQFYARDSFSIQFYAVCVKKHQVHPWKSADSAATSQTETREEEEEAEILELFDGR